METPKCLVCCSTSSVPCLSLNVPTGKITYFQCPECSLVFQDPQAPFKAEDIYNAQYIQKRSQDPENINTTLPREKTAEHYYQWVEQYVAKGNLLEVGCATGLALKVAQSKGWNVFGIEVNKEAAQIANQVLKADVVKSGHLNDTMFPDNYFSLIALFDVIEHIPHPVEFLSVLHKKTAPGGHILFLTPDVDTLSFKLLKEKWPHFVQEHLVLLSAKSMNRLLKESGFTPKARGWATKHISIDMLRTHAAHHPNTLLYKPISWVLGAIPGLKKAIIPFNLGEMFVLAEKIH